MNVLIACPTYSGKDYCLDEYLNSILRQKLSGHIYSVIIIDNSEDNGEYYNKLKEKTKQYDNFYLKRIEYDYLASTREKISDSYNSIRDFFLGYDFDYLLLLEADVIMPRDNFLEEMIDCFINNNLQILSGLVKFREDMYFLYRKERTRWKDSDNPNFKYSIYREYPPEDELRYILNRELVEVGSTSFGCLLINKIILERIDFKWKNDYQNHSDCFFFIDCIKNNIRVILKPGLITTHLFDKDWTNKIKKL